jgi:hypothetical protein
MKIKKKYFLSVLACLFLFLSGALGGESAAEYVIYVSPTGNDSAGGLKPDEAFATIGRARDAVRELKRRKGSLDQPVRVCLRGGDYNLTEPIVFTPTDSGTESCPITYTAYAKEKPVIHGGRKITGWKLYKDNIWMADVPAAAAGQWKFRQLYVNGAERRRARFPNEGFYRVAGFPDGGPEADTNTASRRFEYKPGDFNPAWTNPRDIEVIVYHFWTDAHLPVESIDDAKHIVTLQWASHKRLTDAGEPQGARYIVENVFEGLDQPGEWYHNRQTGALYYIPMPGEDMTKAEVIAPLSLGLMQFAGNPLQRDFVEHLRFENLAFRYVHWDLPVGQANDIQAASATPGAIVLEGASHCRFVHCEIANIGTYAFELRNGCRSNEFVANDVHSLAAGGWRINGGTEQDPPLARTARNVIRDNHLYDFGTVYPSAVGLLLMNTEGNIVSHNHVHHGWYTGISVGWVWGYTPSVSRDNVIEYNHIHHIGQGLLSDMGAIYTLGVSPGTVIRNNLIHDVESYKYGGWGIYNDEGSTHILIENNVVYNTLFAPYIIHYCKEVTVRNNIFAMGVNDQLHRGVREQHISVFFTNNILYWKQGKLLAGNWSDRPYEFYTSPHSSKQQRTDTFQFDWNVYFNPNLTREQLKFEDEETWDQWQKRGKDVHSVYADPMFVDAEHFDFRLKPESPALAMGFNQIDVSTIGPREKPGLVN